METSSLIAPGWLNPPKKVNKPSVDMAKRRRESDSDGTTPTAAAEQNPVFVETSIDTRLVVLVSESESVSDFKRKIASEHMQCFPKFGEIEVHSLKVQCRGSFYHLTDIMHVWTAFQGVRGSWFLYVDASRTTSLCCEKEKPLELGASGGMEIDERSIENHHRDLPALTLSLEDRDTEKDIVNEGLRIEPSDNLKENFTATESPVKKKCKLRHGEDIAPGLTLEDNSDVVVPVSDKVEALKVGVVEAAEVMLNENQQEKSPMLEATAENSSMRNDQPNTENGVLFDGTTLAAEAVKDYSQGTVKLQNLSGSDPKEGPVLESVVSEIFVASKLGNRSEKFIVAEKLVGETVKVPHFSGTMDVDGESGDINSEGVKRKKKKSRKSAPKTHDAPVAEDTVSQGERQTTETYTAEEKEGKNTQHTDEEKEEKTKFSGDGDDDLVSSQLNASVPIDPGTVTNETGCSEPMLESNVVLEPESLIQKKKRKKSGNKHLAINLENSSMEQADNIMSEDAVNEKFMTNKVDHEPEQDVAIKQSQVCKVEVLNSRGKLVDSRCGTGEINSDRDRKKKKKISNGKDPQVRDKLVEGEQASKAISDSAGAASLTSEEKKVPDDFSQSHNDELMKSSQLKLTSDSTRTEITPNEEICLQQIPESNIVAKRDISVTSQKKKKTRKKTVGTNLENSAVEKTDTSVSVSSSLLRTDHNPLESDKGGAIQKSNLNNGPMEKNDPNSNNKLEDADSIEAVLTQPEKYLESVAAEKRMVEKAENSAKNTNILESNREESDINNTQNKDKKGKKSRTKKVKSSSSGVQANLFNNQLQITSIPLSTEENSRNQVHFEQENRHVASSQVLPPESEEKPVEMQGTVVNTDGSQEPVENVDERINFKNYFVPTESKDDATNVEKTTKPNEKAKTRKKVKKHHLPLVGNSSELQDPDKSLDTQKGEDGSRVSKRTRSKRGDAAHDYDSDKVVPGPIKRSSITSGNEVKNPSPVDVMETKTPKKPRNISSQPKEVEKPLDISSTARSRTIPEKKGSSKLQSDRKGATNKSAMKMSPEKSLLSKSGPIFQDVSGDSCADDNGAIHSDARVDSESDSSSTSDSSDGESNLSPKTGPIRRRGTGSTKVAKLELSNVSKDVTMDMLLRRSKWFKDAKEIASQNEDEEIEFVPESQA